jgi:hypothetical protein
VYCAPTSGGKSLVAEVLMLRRIMATNRPAMVVLPFVSICSEKSEHLRWAGWSCCHVPKAVRSSRSLTSHTTMPRETVSFTVYRAPVLRQQLLCFDVIALPTLFLHVSLLSTARCSAP